MHEGAHRASPQLSLVNTEANMHELTELGYVLEQTRGSGHSGPLEETLESTVG